MADSATDRILGIHILGAHAGELIQEGALALESGVTVHDLAKTSHAHPTLCESIKEAALGMTKSPIHL